MALVEVGGAAAAPVEVASGTPWRSISVSLRFGFITRYKMFDGVHAYYCKCRTVSTSMFFSTSRVCSFLRAGKDQLEQRVCGDLTTFTESKVLVLATK